ncbi:hypothetical protein [Pararobbsia alpina]|uniref:Lipoprotein n=1 Tax=Pararobbsia alpina TaxID=621374 RepID=A0A6S7BNE5_9BURK|nr:hypothetical protein [Pararobbsia alpina]CAB3797211.1 hypothetical protein LMG28138_04211 [Pararobbsia alpina]
MKTLLALSLVLTALPVFAGAPTCQTQTLGKHAARVCITSAPFQHDYYTLSVDEAVVLVAPDDFIENVSLTHTIPEDAAVEFPLSQQGTPTVAIQGGCVPVSEKQTSGSETIGIEVARLCSFKWGNEQIVKDLRFNFE